LLSIVKKSYDVELGKEARWANDGEFLFLNKEHDLIRGTVVD